MLHPDFSPFVRFSQSANESTRKQCTQEKEWLQDAAQKILQDLPGVTFKQEEYLQPLKISPPTNCFCFREITLVEVVPVLRKEDPQDMKNQNGFMRSRSTVDAILSLLDFALEDFEARTMSRGN
ncbi:hypothetical protein HHI36_003669 [Cryptolaemus montrouzieri]|uniref:Uncharacterized protein n=1 Tax=Cryptolaemus montrouzieri TaxID=559131 RepID=A0ABD2PF35_9CUCU